jgi:hypothetical protein
MRESAADIIERLFARARDDRDAAPLADAFAAAYHDGDWTADALDARIRVYVAERSAVKEAAR